MIKAGTKFNCRLRHSFQAMVSLHPVMTDGTAEWMNLLIAGIIKENAP
jgi:hypothetical protein